MKKSELKQIIGEAIREVEGEETLPKALPDVQRLHDIMSRFINNRMEWAQMAVDVLEYDVPQKTAAINTAFEDKPSLRSQLVKYYGDEKDTSVSHTFKQSAADIKDTPVEPEFDQEEAGEGEQ